MSFKKNYFYLAIVTIALIAILTACGSSAPAEESTQAVLGDPEKTRPSQRPSAIRTAILSWSANLPQ